MIAATRWDCSSSSENTHQCSPLTSIFVRTFRALNTWEVVTNNDDLSLLVKCLTLHWIHTHTRVHTPLYSRQASHSSLSHFSTLHRSDAGKLLEHRVRLWKTLTGAADVRLLSMTSRALVSCWGQFWASHSDHLTRFASRFRGWSQWAAVPVGRVPPFAYKWVFEANMSAWSCWDSPGNSDILVRVWLWQIFDPGKLNERTKAACSIVP